MECGATEALNLFLQTCWHMLTIRCTCRDDRQLQTYFLAVRVQQQSVLHNYITMRNVKGTTWTYLGKLASIAVPLIIQLGTQKTGTNLTWMIVIHLMRGCAKLCKIEQHHVSLTTELGPRMLF